MQVEYEDQQPTSFATSSVLPPKAASEAQSDDEEQEDEQDVEAEEEEQDDEEEEEEEEEQVETETGEPAEKTKTKRVAKQRQSLAEKEPGTTIFPISRVKRICKADKDLDMMTSEATFMVAVATEYFVKHFMEEGYTKARLDKRRLVTYKDMANVVARSEEFDFLSDVIPLPVPMSEAIKARVEKQAADENMMDDQEDADEGGLDGAGPVDMTGADVLPPLTHSTNPLFPNAIVKRATHSHAKAAPRTSKSGPGAEGGAGVGEVGPSPQTKPFGAKYAPTVAQSLTTRSRRSLAASEIDAEMHPAERPQEQETAVIAEGASAADEANVAAEPTASAPGSAQADDRMDQD